MTAPAIGTRSNVLRAGRSALAIFAGFFTVVALSLGTDQVLHVLKVYPPWSQPVNDPKLLLLALTYRCAYAVLGSYIAARLAPVTPMRHAMALGVVGFLLSLGGMIIATYAADLGPLWYPAGLVVTTLPCAWLGGALQRRGSNR